MNVDKGEYSSVSDKNLTLKFQKFKFSVFLAAHINVTIQSYVQN